MVFNTGLYTDLPDNSILITANMQSETDFPSSHQLKSYVAFKSRLKLTARAVLSADAGLLVVVDIGLLKLATMFTAGGGSEHMARRGSHFSKIFNVLNCIAAVLRTFD